MLETVLERIAVALEKQNEMTAQLINAKPGAIPVPPAQGVSPKVEKKAPKNAPVVEKVLDDGSEMFQEGPEITLDTLKELLTGHAKAFGPKVTIELIKKHGADAVTPKINTIPQVNWQACWDEACAELKKVKK